MAGRQVVADFLACAECGQEVDATRRRCPGCGGLLPARPRSASPVRAHAGAAPTPSGRARAAALGFALVAVGAATDGVTMAPRVAAPPPSTATLRLFAAPVASPPPVSTRALAGDAAAHEAVDAGRAGSAAYAGGDLTVALAEYEKALARDPGDTTTRGNRAQVLVRLGRVADALTDLDRVVQERPDAWASHFNRGRAHSLLTRWPEAIKDYQSAARLFPDDYVTHYNLGLAHARTNDHAAAVTAFERAVALAPGEPSFLIALGTEYLAANRTADAQRIFEQFLRDHPEAAEAQNARTLLDAISTQSPAHRRGEANRTCTRLFRLEPSSRLGRPSLAVSAKSVQAIKSLALNRFQPCLAGQIDQVRLLRHWQSVAIHLPVPRILRVRAHQPAA